MPDDDRETAEVPADWRRAAWGCGIVLIGAVASMGAAAGGVSIEAVRFGAGMLLVGLGAGWTDHLIAREQERMTARARSWLNQHVPRA